MTARARFTETDVARAMKGARKAGFASVRVTIDVAGNMDILASDLPAVIPMARKNPLDRLLPST